MNEQTDDELFELYSRFKQELNGGNFNEFYDVDDLIAIFDKATDYNDNYVRMEVLFRGQQYFPGNEELRVRRGFLYLDLEIEEGVRSITNSTVGRNPLRTILKLRTQVNTLSPQDAKLRLEKLIDLTEIFDTETILQLVDCVRHYGLADWFRKVLPRLRRKVEDLQVLLCQSSSLFSDAADYSTAISIIEELTDLAPFEIDYWTDLAYCYIKLKQPEHALTVIEYALAIDHMDIDAIALKADALAELNRYEEVEQLLAPHVSRLISIEEDFYERLIQALMKLGRKQRAFDILRTRAEAHPAEDEPINVLLFFQAPDVSDLVQSNFDLVGKSDIEKWVSKANAFYSEGNYYAALEMYAAMENGAMLPISERGFYASALYVMKRYADCARLLRTHIDETPGELTLDICAAGLLSMCHLREFDDARLTVEILRGLFPFDLETQWRIGTNLARVGIHYLLTAVETQLRDPEHFDIKAVDVFQAPMNYTPDLQ